MNDTTDTEEGLRRLIRKCREEFRLPENENFYSEEDYRFVALTLRLAP